MAAELRKGTLIVQVQTVAVNAPHARVYVVLTLDDQAVRTSVAPAAMPSAPEWNESFRFRLTLTSQLFASLQVDLYAQAALPFLADRHLGRSEVRISKLAVLPDDSCTWFELWRRDLSHSALSVLGRRAHFSENIGAVRLHIKKNLHATAAEPPAPPTTASQDKNPAPLADANADADAVAPFDPMEMSLEVLQDYNMDERDPYHVDSDDEENSIFTRVGNLVFSKETNAVLRSMKKLFATFGQGLEVKTPFPLN
jgi:hypothetical protein